MRSTRAALAVVAVTLAVGAPAALASGDPMRGEQYGLDAIRAPEAWPVAQGRGTVIAIVDTGIDHDHPDLVDALLRDSSGQVVGFDAIDGGEAADEHGHGTLVAGTAAATTGNGTGIASVAPQARLMPVRVLDDGGRGSVRDVDAGIRWAVDNGADVVNLSLESAVPLPGDVLSGGLDGAVRYAWERGVVVVAAAGNSGTPFTDYASSTPVLLVGATDRQDRQTTFSDSGRRDMVLAPGVDIVSTWCDPCGDGGTSTYAAASGTSFAAPHAAGAVAVLRSSGLSHERAVARLRETANPVPRPRTSLQQGHGLIDVAAAVGVPDDEPPQQDRSSSQPPPTSDEPDAAETEPARGEQGPPPAATSPAPSSDPASGAGDADDDPSLDADGGVSAEASADDPPPIELVRPEEVADDEVALPAPERGQGPPIGLVLLAGALVIGTGLASLSVLGRAATTGG